MKKTQGKWKWGKHTPTITSDWGLASDRIKKLKEKGVFKCLHCKKIKEWKLRDDSNGAIVTIDVCKECMDKIHSTYYKFYNVRKTKADSI